MTPRQEVQEIIATVAWRHGVTLEELKGPRKYRKVAYARFEAMHELRSLTRQDGTVRFSTTHIGQILGGRDHTTVIAGLRRYQERGAQ